MPLSLGDSRSRVSSESTGSAPRSGERFRPAVLSLFLLVTAPAVAREPARLGRSARAGLDQTVRLTSQGRPWFPLGLYATPYTRARRLELGAAGFDLVVLDPLPPHD